MMSNITINNNNTNNNSNNNNNNFAAPPNNDVNKSNNNNLIQVNAPLMNSFEKDVIRLIGQHLSSLGLKQTVDLLLRETGLQSLDHPLAAKFQHSILIGHWDEAKDLVGEISAHCPAEERSNTLKEMQLMIAERKYLEAIEENQRLSALKCLRLELTPYYYKKNNIKRIHYLTNLLFCRDIHEFRQRADYGTNYSIFGSRQQLLNRLQKYIPTIMMLPSDRLRTLLSQALELQRNKCMLHTDYGSNDIEDIDLKNDHVCKPDNIPIDCRQLIDAHKGEIWYCQFSHDGSKLATGGQGGNVKIWDVDITNYKLTERCQFDNHGYSINCLSWSPTDEHLLVCLSDSKPGLNIWHINREVLEKSIMLGDDQWTATCSWHPSGNIFAAASIKGNFIVYDLDGNVSGQREGLRVMWLSFLNKDDKNILAADNLHRITSYRLHDMLTTRGVFEGEVVINEERPIMSFTVDSEDKYLAVNLANQGVHLWDYKNRSLLKIFSHSRQSNFVIHSSFSGKGTFLATGSEDGRVYIYSVQKNDPIAILHGHSRCSNSVSWNPKHPELLVSVGDDRLIRLWGPLSNSSNLKTHEEPNTFNSQILNSASLGSNSNFIYNKLISIRK